MDYTSLLELRDLMEQLSLQSDQVKVIVLTGGLPDFFINHGDISGLQVASPEFDSWLDVFHRLEEVPQPTIAAIDGLASGAGSEIALACTLRVGSSRARLQQSEITAGVIPGGGATVRLPRLVGPGIAAEAILTGRIFDADEAFRIGWLNSVLPADRFLERTLEWAERVAQHSGPALVAAKMSLRASSHLPFAEAIAREREIFYRHLADAEIGSGER
jgi:enoyl-CoA hydratase